MDSSKNLKIVYDENVTEIPCLFIILNDCEINDYDICKIYELAYLNIYTGLIWLNKYGKFLYNIKLEDRNEIVKNKDMLFMHLYNILCLHYSFFGYENLSIDEEIYKFNIHGLHTYKINNVKKFLHK